MEQLPCNGPEDFIRIYDVHGPEFGSYLENYRERKDGAHSAGMPLTWPDGPDGKGLWTHDWWPNPGLYQHNVFIPQRFFVFLCPVCDRAVVHDHFLKQMDGPHAVYEVMTS